MSKCTCGYNAYNPAQDICFHCCNEQALRRTKSTSNEDLFKEVYMTNKITPKHYKGNKLEEIDIINDFNLNFNLGNVIKYVLRAGKKDETIQELEKAKKYLEYEIERIKNVVT